jgi:hypothetical protein
VTSRPKLLLPLALAPFLTMAGIACGTVLDIEPDPPTMGAEGGEGGGGPGGEGGAGGEGGEGEGGPATGGVVATGRGLIYSLVVDVGFVYFGSRSGVVGRIGATGVNYTEYVSDAGAVEQVAVDATHVYVASYTKSGAGVIRSRKVDPDVVEIIDTCPEARAIALDDTSAFWLSTGCGGAHVGAKRFAADASVATSFLPPLDAFAAGPRDGHLVVDGTRVYYASQKRMAQLPKTLTGTPTSMSDWTFSTESVNGLALDGAEIFVRGNYMVSAVYGNQQSSTVTSHGNIAALPMDDDRTGIASDATHVYFAATNGGEVRRFAKGTQLVSVFARDPGKPLAIALDADYVYWSNTLGEIRRAPKK